MGPDSPEYERVLMRGKGSLSLHRRAIFNRNFFIMIAIDTGLLYLSWVGAYLLRFDLRIPEEFFDEMRTVT